MMTTAVILSLVTGSVARLHIKWVNYRMCQFKRVGKNSAACCPHQKQPKTAVKNSGCSFMLPRPEPKSHLLLPPSASKNEMENALTRQPLRLLQLAQRSSRRRDPPFRSGHFLPRQTTTRERFGDGNATPPPGGGPGGWRPPECSRSPGGPGSLATGVWRRASRPLPLPRACASRSRAAVATTGSEAVRLRVRSEGGCCWRAQDAIN